MSSKYEGASTTSIFFLYFFKNASKLFTASLSIFFHFEVLIKTKFGSNGGSSLQTSTILETEYGTVELSFKSCLTISFVIKAISSMCLAKTPT